MIVEASLGPKLVNGTIAGKGLTERGYQPALLGPQERVRPLASTGVAFS